MKKLYNTPSVELMNLSTADVITLSILDELGLNDWNGGIDVSNLEFTQQS